MAIKFGTSGWRAIMAEEFTFENVRRLSHAISAHVKDHPEFGHKSSDYRQFVGKLPDDQEPTIVIGYDPRFQGNEFAYEAALVFAHDGIRVLMAKEDIPTPALAWAVLEKKAIGGVVVTASHNSSRYNGIKWSPFWAGPATLGVTDDIERRLVVMGQAMVRTMPYAKAERDQWIVKTDFKTGYFKQLRKLLDPSKLKNSKLKIGVDAMHGSARTYLRPFLETMGLEAIGLREDRDVDFAGSSPEPSPEKLKDLAALMKKKKLNLGMACDGDADRFGILDQGGVWISANEVLALTLHHLIKNRGWTGSVARSHMTSHFVDAIAKSHGLRVRETPVGFKHIGDLLRTGEFVLGGEESGGLSVRGHAPEKDGLLACLLMAELVAFEKKPLVKIRQELFKKHGEFHNTRLNFTVSDEKFVKDLEDRLKIKAPTNLDNTSVWRIDDTDGYKFILKDGRWLGLRFSGTEPVVRLYAEAFDEKGLKAMVSEGKKIIEGKK